MAAEAARSALLRRLATFAALCTFVIVVASAFLRLSAPHEGCVEWPACYGKVTQAADGTEPSAPRRIARLFHRIAAVAVSAAIAALAILCFIRHPVSWTDRRLAVALLALVAFLAVLGRWTPTGALLPVITVANLAGGLGLLALLWWLRLRHAEEHGHRRETARAVPPLVLTAAAAVALLAAASLLGALVSANYAALSCTTLPDCNGAWWPAATLSAFDMFRTLAVDDAQRVQLAAYAPFLHMLHRYLAAAAVLVTGGLALWLLIAGKHSRRLGIIILVLLTLQIGLGVAAVSGSLPLAVVVLHNATAALLLLAGVALVYRLTEGLDR